VVTLVSLNVGLFAVLSIIRLRSETVSNIELGTSSMRWRSDWSTALSCTPRWSWSG
jgi:hypothetical protein